VAELTITTERHTQLLDITAQVRDAVRGEEGAAVHGLADPVRRRHARQLRVALVERLQVELGRVAGVVEVLGLLALGQEALGLLAEAVELGRGRRRGLHAP
jgi:hypothetical protein